MTIFKKGDIISYKPNPNIIGQIIKKLPLTIQWYNKIKGMWEPISGKRHMKEIYTNYSREQDILISIRKANKQEIKFWNEQVIPEIMVDKL